MEKLFGKSFGVGLYTVFRHKLKLLFGGPFLCEIMHISRFGNFLIGKFGEMGVAKLQRAFVNAFDVVDSAGFLSVKVSFYLF